MRLSKVYFRWSFSCFHVQSSIVLPITVATLFIFVAPARKPQDLMQMTLACASASTARTGAQIRARWRKAPLVIRCNAHAANVILMMTAAMQANRLRKSPELIWALVWHVVLVCANATLTPSFCIFPVAAILNVGMLCPNVLVAKPCPRAMKKVAQMATNDAFSATGDRIQTLCVRSCANLERLILT
jgi:hypothetical protein